MVLFISYSFADQQFFSGRLESNRLFIVASGSFLFLSASLLYTVRYYGTLYGRVCYNFFHIWNIILGVEFSRYNLIALCRSYPLPDLSFVTCFFYRQYSIVVQGSHRRRFDADFLFECGLDPAEWCGIDRIRYIAITNCPVKCNVSVRFWFYHLTSVADPWHFGTDADPDGSVPLTDGSWSDAGSGSGSCYFRQWPSRWQYKFFCLNQFLAYYF